MKYGARITSVTSPVYADTGESVLLECQADAHPKRHGMVKWMKAGRELQASSGESGRAVLTVRASKENSGDYICVADNGVGEPNFTTAYLLVNSAPLIQRWGGHDRAAGQLRGFARARCRAQAVPTVQFFWSRDDGVAIRESVKYQIKETRLDQTTFESVLLIRDLEPQDFERRLRCQASNAMGQDEQYVSVGRPTAPDVPAHFSVAEVNMTSAALTWTAGFDGGSDQIFEVRFGADDRNLRTANTSMTVGLRGSRHPSENCGRQSPARAHLLRAGARAEPAE